MGHKQLTTTTTRKKHYFGFEAEWTLKSLLRLQLPKKFASKNPKKIREVAEYIKEHAIAWAVEYEDEKVIDEINILQATQSAMHKAIKDVMRQITISDTNTDNIFLLIDGNYFKPITIFYNNNGALSSRVLYYRAPTVKLPI